VKDQDLHPYRMNKLTDFHILFFTSLDTKRKESRF